MVVLTGSSGFLNKFIKAAIHGTLITIGRSKTADIVCDLSLNVPKIPPADIIIHSAGKAHFVPKTEIEAQMFYDVNVTGTQNLLSGLETSESIPKAFVYISSVAVYGLDYGQNISEGTKLNAIDAYGKSKIEAEKLVSNWCEKHQVICSILRLPLLAGQNPPGNLKAMIAGIDKGYYFNIAGGKAKKSIVLAEDVAQIIPVVARIGGTYNLTDRYHPSFEELSVIISKQLHKSKPKSMPQWIANSLAVVGNLLGPKAIINSNKLAKITKDLTFDDSRAVTYLGWDPKPVLQHFKI